MMSDHPYLDAHNAAERSIASRDSEPRLTPNSTIPEPQEQDDEDMKLPAKSSESRSPKSAPKKAKKGAVKYKKAPQAPKRFKPAFIIYSTEKHKEIRAKLGEQGHAEKTTDVAKLVSEAWRELSAEEREKWDELARQDKTRYEVEKATYRGPWKVPAAKKRKTKDPSAPKRPMSAFLAFSNSRRAGIKRMNPSATNGDISRILSTMWKEASPELRQRYIDEEARLREEYKVVMAEWRRENEEQQRPAASQQVVDEEAEPANLKMPARAELPERTAEQPGLIPGVSPPTNLVRGPDSLSSLRSVDPQRALAIAASLASRGPTVDTQLSTPPAAAAAASPVASAAAAILRHASALPSAAATLASSPSFLGYQHNIGRPLERPQPQSQLRNALEALRLQSRPAVAGLTAGSSVSAYADALRARSAAPTPAPASHQSLLSSILAEQQYRGLPPHRAFSDLRTNDEARVAAATAAASADAAAVAGRFLDRRKVAEAIDLYNTLAANNTAPAPRTTPDGVLLSQRSAAAAAAGLLPAATNRAAEMSLLLSMTNNSNASAMASILGNRGLEQLYHQITAAGQLDGNPFGGNSGGYYNDPAAPPPDAFFRFKNVRR